MKGPLITYRPRPTHISECDVAGVALCVAAQTLRIRYLQMAPCERTGYDTLLCKCSWCASHCMLLRVPPLK